MKYCNAKLKWSELKEGGTGVKKISKTFLVRADSISEAEMRVMEWCPANYQDAEVKGVNESDILEVIKKGESEEWWAFVLSDENESGKFVPFNIVINGRQEQEVLKDVLTSKYITSQFEAMKRFKIIVDDDLIAEDIVKRDTISDEQLEHPSI